MLGPILLLALTMPQDETSPDARERLEALIQSTNALEHFHAEYELLRDGKPGSIVFDYRAPGQVRIRGESERGRLDSGCSEDVLWISSERASEGAYWAEVDYLDRGGELEPVLKRLRSPFWRRTESPEVTIGLTWDENEASGRPEISTTVSQTLVGGHAHFVLLGWLHELAHSEGELTLDTDELLWIEEGVVCRVDLESGFLRELVLSSEEREVVRLTLVRLELDEAPDDDEFVRPAPLPGAEDVSEQVRGAMFSPSSLRHHVLRHVHALIEREDRGLDGEPRDELRSLLAGLIQPITVRSFAEFLETVRSNSQEFADWVRSALAAGRPRNEVEDAIAERRRYLDEQVERGRVTYLKQFPDPEAQSGPSWRAIRELEVEVIEECYELAFARAVLEHFEQAIQEALGR
jgi:hypothetical protein